MGRSETAAILLWERPQSLSTPLDPHDIYPAIHICCTPKHSFNISQNLSQGYVCELQLPPFCPSSSLTLKIVHFFCLLIWVCVFCLENFTWQRETLGFDKLFDISVLYCFKCFENWTWGPGLIFDGVWGCCKDESYGALPESVFCLCLSQECCVSWYSEFVLVLSYSFSGFHSLLLFVSGWSSWLCYPVREEWVCKKSISIIDYIQS